MTFLATIQRLAASLIFGTDDFDSWEYGGSPGTLAGRGIRGARRRLSRFWIRRVPLWSAGSPRRVSYSLNTWDYAVSLWVLKDLGKSERASPARLNWSPAMDSDKPTCSMDGATGLGAVKHLLSLGYGFMLAAFVLISAQLLAPSVWWFPGVGAMNSSLPLSISSCVLATLIRWLPGAATLKLTKQGVQNYPESQMWMWVCAYTCPVENMRAKWRQIKQSM